MKREINEGSEEFELLQRKYYAEELKKTRPRHSLIAHLQQL
jgi:hypothetical protein